MQVYQTEGGLKEKLGNKYLSEITTEILQDVVNCYKAEGKASKTIKNYINVVSVIFKMAKVDNYLRRDVPDPVEFLKLPKTVSQEGTVYSMEQVMLMFQRAEVYAHGKMNVKSTKTKAGQRIIPISSDGLVYKVLSEARKQYLKEQSRTQDFQGDNHVFILHHEPYTPVNANRLYKIYKRFLEKECPDLPHYRLHDLHHTYFTLVQRIRIQ